MRIDKFVPLLSARTVLVGALALGIVPGRAEAAQIPLNVGATTQGAAAQRICESVIQLQPGDGLFGNCASSLTESLQSANHARAVARGRDGCFASTPKLDNANLDLCLLRVEMKPDADDMQLRMAAPDEPSNQTDAAHSFYAVSPDIKVAREQRACAIVGFDPAFGAFARCVSNLQDALGNSGVADGEGDAYSID